MATDFLNLFRFIWRSSAWLGAHGRLGTYNFTPMSSLQPSLSHPGYRPDIDGLRAIAVLAVVIFHAFPDRLRGGFIGVDIFFVISGYLISTIIFENLDKGTFSFSEFYARRIKRIFPALLLVLAVIYVLGWFSLLADEYKQLGKHIAAGAGFVSNIVLWNEAGYFDNSAETKPLLHLWSLGIEEQFYIVWPFFLWLAWKRKFNLLTITILVVAISYFLNVQGVKTDTVAAFYSPQTRFWELLCGSLLAWVTLYQKGAFATIQSRLDARPDPAAYRKGPEADGKVLPNVLSFVGLLLLVYGFLRINRELNFPGKWAIIPVLGAMLIIFAGPKAWINKNLLSNKAAVFLGLISFPLYLWHWPLLSFARIVESEIPGGSIRIVAVILSVVLAWLTYKLVEHPMRFGRHGREKVVALVVLMVITGCVGYSTYKRDGFGFRDAEKATQINRFDRPYKESCEKLTGESYGDDWCNAGTSFNQPVSMVMIGDSFSNAYSPMLNAYAGGADSNVSFVQFGRGQCPSLLDYGPAYCRLITSKSFEYIRENPAIKEIILASNWPDYFKGKDFHWVRHIESAEAFKVAFEKTVRAYRAMGREMIVLLAPPVGSSPKSCIIRPVRLSDRNICNLSVQTARANDGNYRDYLIPLLKNLNIVYFDPFIHFCDEAECKITEAGKIFSADGGHLSIFGGEYLAERGKSDLRAIFMRGNQPLYELVSI